MKKPRDRWDFLRLPSGSFISDLEGLKEEEAQGEKEMIRKKYG